MAQVFCPNCKHMVEQGQVCSQCGAILPWPTRKQGMTPAAGVLMGCGGVALLGVIAFFVFVAFISRTAPPQSPTSDRSTDTQPGPPSSSNWIGESGKWVSESTASAMNDSKGIILALPAENDAHGWLSNHRPNLVVRCQEGKTDVYVDTGMPATVESAFGGHTVRIRIDEQRAVSEKWSDSTDNKGLFAPKPMELLKKLAKAKTLLFEFTPFNASPTIITFEVHGLGQHLSKANVPCKWKS